VGATPELLAPLDPRLLATGASPTELAAAIDRAIDLVTPSFRAHCRNHAVSTWSWQSVVPLWEAALQATVAKRRPPARLRAEP
jgi:hypothetical protein